MSVVFTFNTTDPVGMDFFSWLEKKKKNLSTEPFYFQKTLCGLKNNFNADLFFEPLPLDIVSNASKKVPMFYTEISMDLYKNKILKFNLNEDFDFFSQSIPQMEANNFSGDESFSTLVLNSFIILHGEKKESNGSRNNLFLIYAFDSLREFSLAQIELSHFVLEKNYKIFFTKKISLIAYPMQ
jgi:hypothetical protein